MDQPAGRRIRISKGFYIVFARDGRALHRGIKEEHVLEAIDQWLRDHTDHFDRGAVERWREQKASQIEEDERTQAVRGKRAEVIDEVDKATRPYGPKFTEAARKEILRQRGIPETDD